MVGEAGREKMGFAANEHREVVNKEKVRTHVNNSFVLEKKAQKKKEKWVGLGKEK